MGPCNRAQQSWGFGSPEFSGVMWGVIERVRGVRNLVPRHSLTTHGEKTGHDTDGFNWINRRRRMILDPRVNSTPNSGVSSHAGTLA